MQVRTLADIDHALVARIDRSEHVDVEYEVIDGRLVERPVTMADIPPWDLGTGHHSVTDKLDFCLARIAEGGIPLGAFDDGDDGVLGIAIVHPRFEPPLAWLSFLHVSRPHRRRGVARALWDAAADLAGGAGATSMYVSATPTGSAVGFYLSRGCVLADPVHPRLHAEEPEDIHLVCPLQADVT
jgi:GNAT superfamily N-acetyltransferase